ncbi:MAG: magnesium-dependent phosphatase-1 [Conexivisphaerales archaeon]
MNRSKGRGDRWLLAIDLDGTVWDHLDISLVDPPYRKVEEGTLVNNQGIRVRLNASAVEFIKWAKQNGAIVASLSWNKPANVFEALRKLGIAELFDHHATDYTAEKDRRLLELLEKLKSEKLNIPADRVVYVDDRDIHVDDIRKNVGDVFFIHIWKGVKDFSEAKRLIQEKLLS